jgi:hypothetical protein
MNFMRMVCISGVLALGAGVAHAQLSKDDGDKFLAFFDKLADTVVADQADCAKMGTDMTKMIDDNKAILDKVNEARKSGKPMPSDVREHVMATSRKMAPSLQKCKDDKNVSAAMKKLPGPPPHH